MFHYTGEYLKVRDIYDREFYTFTPAPLCNGISITLDAELLELLTSAHNLLGILDGMTMYHPDDKFIRGLMITKECCCSLRIDDKDSLSFQEALKGISSGHKDLGNIPNLISAYYYAYGKKVGYSDLLQVYSIILHGSNSNQKVMIRNQAIPLGDVITNLKTYSPTAPEHIMNALYDMIKFINMENHTDIFIKAAMAHYQFEMIHPFEDCMAWSDVF